MKYFSQYRQDRFLDLHIFRKKQGGFFIDIGAHDGISYSNSFFFEKNRNWNGICVEPNPTVFKDLLNNRTSICINACISRSHNQNLPFLKIDGYAEMLSGIKSNYNPEHFQRIKEEVHTKGGSIQEILVETKTLNSLLIENKIEKVDYCSIDVEGSETDVLYSVDLKEFDIEVFTVENNYNHSEVSKILEHVGYKKIKRLGCDEVYVKRRPRYFFVKPLLK
jgi:FkbM family methyltransferase